MGDSENKEVLQNEAVAENKQADNAVDTKNIKHFNNITFSIYQKICKNIPQSAQNGILFWQKGVRTASVFSERYLLTYVPLRSSPSANVPDAEKIPF